jgi:diguanylate cyclase
MAAQLDTVGLDTSLDEVLALLRQQLELDVCVATRREGDELEIVATAGDGIEVEPGLRGPWADSICAHMAAGHGPRVACELASVPSYAESGGARALGIAAYIGAPIMGEDGVVGSVCGLDRRPQAETLVRELPLVELCSLLIGRLWEAEREARTDPLTGLHNRRAWQEALHREEERCQRFGHPAAVLAVDLDDFKEVNDRRGHRAGDEHLRRAADAILGGVREHDVVARWGGDEFCVLAVECDEHSARLLGRRVETGLDAARIPASVGVALRDGKGLGSAVDVAFDVVGERKRPGAASVRAVASTPHAASTRAHRGALT